MLKLRTHPQEDFELLGLSKRMGYERFTTESTERTELYKRFLRDLPWHRPPGQVSVLRGENL